MTTKRKPDGMVEILAYIDSVRRAEQSVIRVAKRAGPYVSSKDGEDMERALFRLAKLTRRPTQRKP